MSRIMNFGTLTSININLFFLILDFMIYDNPTKAYNSFILIKNLNIKILTTTIKMKLMNRRHNINRTYRRKKNQKMMKNNNKKIFKIQKNKIKNLTLIHLLRYKKSLIKIGLKNLNDWTTIMKKIKVLLNL